VLELQPNHLGALVGLASVKREARDLPAAERYLKVALERNPRSVPLHLELIQFYIAVGRSADAEAAFSQALRLNNNSVEILQAQAGYYEGLKKYLEAEPILRRIQASHAADPKYWGVIAGFLCEDQRLGQGANRTGTSIRATW